MFYSVHGPHRHCPPPSYYDTGNPRDLMKPIVTNVNVFVDNNTSCYSAPSVPTWASALSTFTGGLLSGLTFGLLGGGRSWGGFGGFGLGWGGFGANMFGFGRGNLIYDNTLGGQIYSSPQFGAMTLGNYALASTPAATTTTTTATKTDEKKNEGDTKAKEKEGNDNTDKTNGDNKAKKDNTKTDTKHTPTADELNGLINGDAKGKITGSTSTNDIANTVNNLFAGKKQTEDTKDGDNQAKVEGEGKNKGYLKSFTITDASDNIYTLTDPQVDDNGKLTYKIDSEYCDLSGDDKGTNKNYELNKAYNEGTRLEVTIENGQVVLLNKSGEPIARRQGGDGTGVTPKNTQNTTATSSNTPTNQKIDNLLYCYEQAAGSKATESDNYKKLCGYKNLSDTDKQKYFEALEKEYKNIISPQKQKETPSIKVDPAAKERAQLTREAVRSYDRH